MPTRKKRIGFIPRSDVLDLINKLSYESNISYSKVINILVEEALCNRGMFNVKSGMVHNENANNNIDNKSYVNREFTNNFKNKLLKDENLNIHEVKEELLDKEIYAKFLMFLQFQENMKKRDS